MHTLRMLLVWLADMADGLGGGLVGMIEKTVNGVMQSRDGRLLVMQHARPAGANMALVRIERL